MTDVQFLAALLDAYEAYLRNPDVPAENKTAAAIAARAGLAEKSLLRAIGKIRGTRETTSISPETAEGIARAIGCEILVTKKGATT